MPSDVRPCRSRWTTARWSALRVEASWAPPSVLLPVNRPTSDTLAGHAGFELFAGDFAGVAEEAARRAVTMLGARPAPAGTMTVVVGNGFGGVLFHEATGHGLESDAVQKRASVYAGRLGERVAGGLVTAYDDGSLEGEWGTDGIDDEGTPTQSTRVIEEGRLTEYLYDL